MNRSSLNQIGVERAAELLALRRCASHQMGGLVKTNFDRSTLEDWAGKAKGFVSDAAGLAGDEISSAAGTVGNAVSGAASATRDAGYDTYDAIGNATKKVSDPVSRFSKDVWNAKPDLAAASSPGGTGMGQYWNDTAKESLRNALIGGGVGGGIGALKGIISGDDVLQNMLSGGLGGAALGGAGTGLYRGGHALVNQSVTEQKKDADIAAAEKARKAAIAEARIAPSEPGAPGPGDRTGTAFKQLISGDPRGAATSITAGAQPGVVSRVPAALMGQENIISDRPGERNFGTTERGIVGGAGGAAAGTMINRYRENKIRNRQDSATVRAANAQSAAAQKLRAAGHGKKTRKSLSTAAHPGPKAPKLPGRSLPVVLSLIGALTGIHSGSQRIGDAPGDQYPVFR